MHCAQWELSPTQPFHRLPEDPGELCNKQSVISRVLYIVLLLLLGVEDIVRWGILCYEMNRFKEKL